ncbi:MAG TPA: hypothetical protein VFM05_15520, partial [Candidatus Saccharimonadales bacterium]|nr:hypothetical protein [Candidatus Saccharimonadales bacterium]
MKRRFLFTICIALALAVTLYGTWPVSAQVVQGSVPLEQLRNGGSLLDLERGAQGNLVNSVTTLANAQTQPSTAVFVSEPYSRSVVKVDGSGTKTVFASVPSGPGPLKFDKNGNLFVLGGPGVLKVTPTGSISTFATDIQQSIVDLTITDDGKLFALVFGTQVAPGQLTPYPHEPTSSIWEVVEGGTPIFLAATENEAPLGQTARGFTTGPGGDFYLAMQGGNAGG